MTMGQRIAEQRKKLGLSQEALGERLEVSRQAVSKWEADGTVPEIDKLIAMSKLFDVSVGWLLGVEEQAKGKKAEAGDTGKTETLSDAQLNMVEEIVAKYADLSRQEKKPSRLPLILCTAASILAVILALRAMDRVDTDQHNYDVQLSNLFSNYSNLQGQLGEVSDQLNELVQGEKLLTDFSFSASAREDLTGAEISFVGTPRRWQEGDSGYLNVRYVDQAGQRKESMAECRWDGSCLTGQVDLDAWDGYHYYFILCHADGSQEQQPLTGGYHYATNVAEGLTSSGFAEMAVLYEEGTLMLFHSFVDVTVPPLLGDGEDIIWTKAEATLFQNEKAICRQDLLAQTDMSNTVYEGGGYLNRMMLWPIPELAVEDGDIITVWLAAKTNSGIEISQQIYEGIRQGDSYTENVTNQLYIAP